MSDLTNSTSYKAGQAHVKNKRHKESDNPYEVSSTQWHLWRAGFRDALSTFVTTATKRTPRKQK
jgi:hypothetical protein